MSDTLSTKHVQILRQQRQILAMMGIEQWVQPASPTLSIAAITDAPSAAGIAPTIESPVSPIVGADTSTNSTTPASLAVINDADEPYAAQDYPAIGVLPEPPLSEPSLPKNNPYREPTDDLTDAAAAQMVAPLVEKLTAPIKSSIQIDQSAAMSDAPEKPDDKIAPFDLQGSSFGDWVLMVDIQALSFDSQKLWHNIIKALSITCEHTSFPICAGMDSRDLANASLAGFVFKLGRSETVSVAALTPLPDGVTHPNLVPVPTLSAMLKDSALKRELWQKITHPPQS